MQIQDFNIRSNIERILIITLVHMLDAGERVTGAVRNKDDQFLFDYFKCSKITEQYHNTI